MKFDDEASDFILRSKRAAMWPAALEQARAESRDRFSPIANAYAVDRWIENRAAEILAGWLGEERG